MAVVMISRGTFAGGEAVARGVAERLGYRCVSREEILEEAWGQGVSAEELLAAMDKRPPLWKRLAGERNVHITLVQAALCKQALGGNLVFHGHVGHLFLPVIRHVISVRVIADMEYRINAAMEQHHFSRKEAAAYVERVDKERQEWARFLFDVDWDNPHLYDLVVNLSRVSLGGACGMIEQLIELDEFKPTAASEKAMRDLTLQSRVMAALATDPRTRGALSAKVAADEGVVTIDGTSHSVPAVEAAPAVARRVEGVKEVKSLVRLLREGRDASG